MEDKESGRKDVYEDTENFDHLFTPERLAQIDRAAAQIDAGEGIPAEQVRDHFRQSGWARKILRKRLPTPLPVPS